MQCIWMLEFSNIEVEHGNQAFSKLITNETKLMHRSSLRKMCLELNLNEILSNLLEPEILFKPQYDVLKNEVNEMYLHII